MKARPRSGVMYKFGTLYPCYIHCYPQQKWDYAYNGDKVELRYKNTTIAITTDDFKGNWLEVN